VDGLEFLQSFKRHVGLEFWTVGATLSCHLLLDACPKDKLKLVAQLARFSRTTSALSGQFLSRHRLRARCLLVLVS
jgi:hypothetical protein